MRPDQVARYVRRTRIWTQLPAERRAAAALLSTLLGASIDPRDLNNVDLSGADLRGADLRGVTLRQANLRYVRFGDDKWRQPPDIPTCLNRADFREADLSHANLRYVVAEAIDLRGADLSHADLRGIDLTGADLRGSQWHNATLLHATLDDAIMEWTSLDLLRERLRQAAKHDDERLRVIHLFDAAIRAAQHPTLTQLIAQINDLLPDQYPWMMRAMAKWLHPDDNAPDSLYAWVDVSDANDQETLTEQAAEPGWVYLIANANETQYKIGLSSDPERRIGKLVVTLPFDIVTLHLMPSNDMAWAERYLHQRYRAKQIRGEWFALTEQDVADICDIDRLDNPAIG